MVRGGRVAALLALVVALVALLAPAQALAHAQLESTVPQRGAVVERQPEEVVFRFDEPVEGNFGAVRVFDAGGRRVDAGDAFHPGGRGSELAVHLRPDLPDGTYTGTYRVVSADAHVISGGVVFSIGEASVAGRTVAELLGGQDSGPVADAVFGLARGLQFAALAVALGALAFLALVWRGVLAAGAAPAAAAVPFARRHRALVVATALIGALSGAAGVVMQGAEAAGISGWEALRPAIVEETLGTRFGTVWGLGVVAWLGLAALAAGTLGRTRADAPRDELAPAGSPDAASAGSGTAVRDPAAGRVAPVVWLLALPAAFLLLLPALSGHASSQSPTWLLVPSTTLHVAAMCVWAGGLATLLLALPAATRALPERGDRSRLLAAALLRFSPLALGAVALLLASGIVQSVVEVRTVAHLFDTAFGRAVLVKVVLFAALVALGALQRRRVLPRLRALAADGTAPGGAGLLLRRTLRGELALIAGVLAATAALTAYAPSVAEQAGPFDRTLAMGPLQLQLTVDPAAVGGNELHVYLLDPRDGSQFDGTRELRITATQEERGIGPLDVPADRAGPGHYVANADLGAPGDWTVRVTARVSDFDEHAARVEVPVR